MLDIGWSELLVIGVVALVVVGPKDLPVMFKTLGRFTAKARGMARDFQRAMEQAADDTGVKDVAENLKKAANPKATGIDALKNAASKFEQWDPTKPGPRTTPAAAPAAAAVTTAATATAATAAATPAPAEPPRDLMAPPPPPSRSSVPSMSVADALAAAGIPATPAPTDADQTGKDA